MATSEEATLVRGGKIIWVDANPKRYAMVIEGGETFVGEFDSPKTNNQAEYLAIIAALKRHNHPDEIRSDSELVVKQLNKEYHIKDDTLRGLALQAWILAQGKVRFVWVPRKENLAGKVLG